LSLREFQRFAREAEENDVTAGKEDGEEAAGGTAGTETITESGKPYVEFFVDDSSVRKRTGLNTAREVIRVDFDVLHPETTEEERKGFLEKLSALARDFSITTSSDGETNVD
jgi:hypothetical protein